MIDVLDFVNFLNVLILEKNCVEYEIIIKLRFFSVIGSVFLEHIELPKKIIDHFQVLFRSDKVVTFGLNYEINFVLVLIKFP